MSRITLASLLLLSAAGCASVPAVSPPPVDELVRLEAQSWVAWKAQDAAFFEDFLAEDHVELGPNGPFGKQGVVSFIRGHACQVASYEIGKPTVTVVSPTSVVLVYRAVQDTHCGAQAVPSPTWATSLYALRDGKWKNVLYQQMPAAR
jgi:hypothetical protein